MEFTAKLMYVRVSPQKARLVLDLIKGRRVEEALDTLLYTKKGIAPQIYKLLRSAVENANYVSAEKGLDIDLDRLYVKHAIANDGPRMKRIRPAPMGRAFRYQRRISHLEHRAGGEGGRATARPELRRNGGRHQAGEEGREEGSGKESCREEGSGEEVCRQEDGEEVKQIPRGLKSARDDK